LTLCVKTDNRSLFKGLNFPFTYFEVDDELDNPDIILNIGKFTPSNKDCYLVDHKYNIKKNYFYCKDSEGKTRWEVEIDGLEDSPTVINFYGKMRGLNRFLEPDVLPQDSIILPIIELCLGKKGFLLAHGSGMVKDGKAIIFLGRGGTLKTTIIMNAVKNNLKILGEERLILNLSDNNMAYVFTMWPQIFEHMVENFKDEDMNISKKVLLFKNLLKERPPSPQVWQAEPVNIKSVYLLKRASNGNNRMDVNPISKDLAIQKIIANNKGEIYASQIPSMLTKRYFVDYMTAYSFILPDSGIAKFWDNMKRGLEEMLSNVPIYEIELSQQYSLNIYEELQPLIKEIE
jgi:hypothetical protein